MAKKKLQKTMDVLVGVGALNWGLVSLLGFNAVTTVTALFGSGAATATTITYAAIGISGALSLWNMFTKKRK